MEKFAWQVLLQSEQNCQENLLLYYIALQFSLNSEQDLLGVSSSMRDLQNCDENEMPHCPSTPASPVRMKSISHIYSKVSIQKDKPEQTV